MNARNALTTRFQKFRRYVIDGDRAVDVVAALLCLLMEFKDDSSASFAFDSTVLTEVQRIQWDLSRVELYDSISYRRAQFRSAALVGDDKDSDTDEMEHCWHGHRLFRLGES